MNIQGFLASYQDLKRREPKMDDSIKCPTCDEMVPALRDGTVRPDTYHYLGMGEWLCQSIGADLTMQELLALARTAKAAGLHISQKWEDKLREYDGDRDDPSVCESASEHE